MTSHYITMSHIWLISPQQLVWQARINLTQLLCCCECCWLRRVWAGQSEQTGYLRGGWGLKETGALFWALKLDFLLFPKCFWFFSNVEANTFEDIIFGKHLSTFTTVIWHIIDQRNKRNRSSVENDRHINGSWEQSVGADSTYRQEEGEHRGI